MTQVDDAAAIAVVQNAYAVAIDDRDWPALRSCFADDASIGFGRPPRVGGPDEFMTWAPAFHAQLGDTLHQITTHRVRLDGAAATASCYLHAVLLAPDGGTSTSVFGRYDDGFVNVDGRWLIGRRRFRAVWRRRDVASDAPLPEVTR